jgi:hypothetical protein
VVVDQGKAFAGGQVFKGIEDQGMAIFGGDRTDVNNFFRYS